MVPKGTIIIIANNMIFVDMYITYIIEHVTGSNIFVVLELAVVHSILLLCIENCARVCM